MLREVRGLDAVPEAHLAAPPARAGRGSSRAASSCRRRSGRPAPRARRARARTTRRAAAPCRPRAGRAPSASSTMRPVRAGLRNSKPSVRRGPGPTSTCSALIRSICFCFDFACLAFVFFAPKRSTKRSSRAISSACRVGRLRGVQRARRLLAPPDVPLAREEDGAPAVELEHGRRHRLEEPAVVRDEDHGRVDRRQQLLEPLDRLDVEVVRRLVEQQQVGLRRERARERGARQLAARERRERPVEVVVGEAEAADDAGRAVAPVVAARVLEPRLRRAVARASCVRSWSPPAIACSSSRSSVSTRGEVGRPREHVVAQRPAARRRRPLVVQRDARALLERELAALERRLAVERAQQRRLAGAVRARRARAGRAARP